MFLAVTLRAFHFDFEPLHERCLQLSHLLYEEGLDLSPQIAWSLTPTCVRRRRFPKVGGLSGFNAETSDDEAADYSNSQSFLEFRIL